MTARIFVGDDVRNLVPGTDFPLPASAARHVAQALRMREGDALTLFTGNGGEYEGTIEQIGRRDVVVRVRRHLAVERENSTPVTLVQAVIASDMMDFVIRKAVELGVGAIAPVLAARSQGLPADRMQRRVAHWRQIAIAACEQCGRNRIPQVHDVVALTQWLATAGARAVILDADASASLAQIASDVRVETIVSGPEGGFSAEELRAANARGLASAHLGPRVLRAETAPLAALATFNALVERSRKAGSGSTDRER